MSKGWSLFIGCSLAIVSSSCGQAPGGRNVQSYIFLVGPSQASQDGTDHRFHVTIARPYIHKLSQHARMTREVSEITFSYHLRTGAPADPKEFSNPDVVLATVGWGPPESVKHSLDGSWQNYYLKYSVKGEPKYGLNSAQGGDRIDTSVLYYSLEAGVMIECESVLGEKLRSCFLTKSVGSYVRLEARFDASLLPNWHSIIKTAAKIAKID